MQLSYGSYAWPANQSEMTSRIVVVRSAFGRPLRKQVQIGVKTIILATGQDALATAENNAITALMIPNQNLTFQTDDGTTVQSLSLVSNASMTGVQIIDGPSFEEMDGPEYVNQRTMRFTAQAEFLMANAGGATIIEFNETVSFVGNGGPRRVWRFPVNGPGIRQTVAPASLVTTTQRGSAVGHMDWPSPPPKMFLGNLVNEADGASRGSPKAVGNAYIEYPISWDYQYQSDGRLVANPNRGPIW